MKKHSVRKAILLLPLKMMTVTALMIAVISGMAWVSKEKSDYMEQEAELKSAKRDSVESVKAFMQAYQVLTSPRCMNCHPSGDVPLQGDDNHIHTMLPQRGKDGKGVYAMKCANCHQPNNTPGLHTPPGNPNWHLPPAEMKMVFQGRTPRQLAKQLIDPEQNGHKTREQLIAHASDALVMSAWNPGEGRTLPPMTYKEFSKAWVKWIKKGAYAPAQ